MTRLKLTLVRLFVVAATLAIGVWQFREGLHRETYGNPLLETGPLWRMSLALVMAAIPMIAFAVGSWLALTHIFFRHGEIAEYRARQLVEKARKAVGAKAHGAASKDAKPDYVD